MELENHITKVMKRNGRIVEFNPERITDAIFRAAKEIGGEDLEIAKEMTRQVVKRLNERFPPDAIPHVEQIQDIVIETLYENDYDTTATVYKNYREQQAQKRLLHQNNYGVVNNIPYKVIYNTLVWNIDHDCDSVDKLNMIVESGRFSELVKAGEQKYHYDLEQLVSSILRRRDELRVIIIAGPSSSGKTTTTIKVAEKLAQNGLELVALNLDNYFQELEKNPKDEFGDYDFERPEALDIPLINEHLKYLLEG
ncbi:MAG: ATP cone domain-containing protein, partial [bacterium]